MHIAQGPHLRTPNSGFKPGYTPPICYIKGGGGEPWVEPGVWRSEMWAHVEALYRESILEIDGLRTLYSRSNPKSNINKFFTIAKVKQFIRFFYPKFVTKRYDLTLS
jgi:hypothetical protein